MKVLLRGIALASLMVCLLGVTGCGTDNESETQKLQSKESVPTPVNKGPSTAPPPPASQAQRTPPSPTGGSEYKAQKK